MMKYIAAVVICLALALGTFAQRPSKDKVWQEGKLINIEAARDAWGHVAYTVDAGEFVYTAGHFIFRGKRLPLPLTINTKVKFAITKDRFYLIDEDGKEHKLTLEKKELKTPSENE